MTPGPGQMLSHYRLVEKIADGGMGVIYKVYDTRLQRHVALKLLKPELTPDPERRARLLDEARAAAAVNHPNIAAVYEVDEADGHAFIVMELVEGATLRSLIERGPLAPADALRIAVGVARGLAKAHQNRVVHRDLKPDNIIVGPDLHAKILDFGLAQILADPAECLETIDRSEEAITRDLHVGDRLAGTVAYMSPEQAQGRPVDARSDVFSFGIVLYEALSGRRPFAADNMTATLARILETHPEPLAAVRADVPEDLSVIAMRCLEKRPEERYADGGDLSRALEEVRLTLRPARVDRIAEASPTTIAVFPFRVRGSQEFAYLGAGLVDLLSTKIDGAGDLRTVDAHVILCCSTIEDGGSSDPEAAAKVAARFGAGLFVLGSVIAAGDRLQIDASLYDAQEGARPVSKASALGEASRIFDMVDTIAAELLAGRCTGPATRLTQIAAATTASFPALKAYLEGESEMRAMRRTTAVDAYRRAVALDPGFGLAWYRLSVAALWSGQGRLAQEAGRRAVEHAGRLTERDQLLVAAFAACVSGSNDEAERRFRNIVGTYPDDVEAWYQLGELLFHWGPLRGRAIEESRQAWERLLMLDPKHVNAWLHIALIEARAGNTAGVDNAAERILALSPGGDPASWMRALRSFSSADEQERAPVMEELRRASDHNVTSAVRILGGYPGDPVAALQLAQLLVEPVRAPEVRALGHVIRAHLELARGRRRACAAELDGADRLMPLWSTEYRALLATALFLPADPAVLEPLRRRVETLDASSAAGIRADAWMEPHEGLHPALRIYLLGLIDSRLGRATGDDAAAGTVGAAAEAAESCTLPSDLRLSTIAHAAAAAGRPDEALAVLERTRSGSRFDQTMWSPFHSQARERYLRAVLLERLGRGEEAIPWYNSFAENSVYDLIYLAPSLLRLAAIRERLGQARQASAHREQARWLWRECDPDLRPVIEGASG